MTDEERFLIQYVDDLKMEVTCFHQSDFNCLFNPDIRIWRMHGEQNKLIAFVLQKEKKAVTDYVDHMWMARKCVDLYDEFEERYQLHEDKEYVLSHVMFNLLRVVEGWQAVEVA